MRADNSKHLLAAARQRSEDTRGRACQAIDQLQRDGESISFATVATAAGVSRNWLYTTADIRHRIEELRPTKQTQTAKPRAKRASDRSKDALLDLLRAKNRELLHKNRELQDQLAASHGALRDSRRQTLDAPATTVGD